MDKLRVVVCGTTFGRIYAAGIRRLPAHYELVAMLSRGSEQSYEFASEQGVPLCTRIEDLPEADMVCVVVRSGIVGGSGSQLAQRFLAAGKHVTLEHPIHHNDVVECYRAAARSGRRFFVNAFYRYSSTVKEYLKLVEVLRAEYGIIYIQAECSVHFLFSMLDMLGRVTGGFTPWHLGREDSDSGVFTTVSGSFRGTPITLRVVNKMNPSSPDDFVHVSHRLTVFTAAGNLVLTETDGQIVWHPNLASPRDSQGVLEVGADERLTSASLHEAFSVETGVTRRTQVEHIWPSAIAEFLALVHHEIGQQAPSPRDAEYTLALCSVWAHAGQLIGPSHVLGSELAPNSVSLSQLRERAAQGARR